ncbi:hypothetical protein BU17DRAFT_95878 [Hysterangium stoloniferum]|nr:hypothetical protein BU17DRAFT_95878 [Hysterangium stoloniferum]
MYSYDDDEDEQYPQEQPRPRDNLQKFVLEAVPFKMNIAPTCPKIPPPDERIQPATFAILSHRPDSRRKLQEVCMLRPVTVMQNRVKNFLSFIPSQPLPNQGYDVEINMDAASFSVVQTVRPPLEYIEGLVSWVMSIASTAERILKLTWPDETAGYAAHVPDLSPILRFGPGYTDNDICRTIAWTKVSGRSESLREPATKMIVMVMAPWALGNLEMRDFIELGTFVPYKIPRENELPQIYKRAEKVWARLWDDCASKSCQFFAVTNYDCWVFGVFVNGTTRAICSPIVNAVDKESTVLQWVLFWMGSSMKLPHTWTPPAFENFGNPDITDLEDVAKRLMDDDSMSHEDWLKAYLKEDNIDHWNTYEMTPNVWYTSFDG